ncbi:MFS general substrate transporter [Backusella circina FSU 941]|nr:MFS general substrate transporter [Backusella circina FSU 941]
MSDVTEDKDIQIVKYEHGSTPSSVEEEINSKKFVKSDAEKRYVRKLNMRLLPIAGLVVFVQFIDKSILSVAAIIGIIEDTGMTYSQYSWLGSLFYLGYLVYQLPNNYILQKVPVGRYLGVMLFFWGALTIATGFCKNFTQLAVTRVLLGLFESASYPVLLLIFNTMYRRSEQSACFGFLWFMNGFASIVGSASAVGVAKMKPVNGLVAWRMGYVIWGTITIGIAILVFFFLIDSPESRWLSVTPEERAIIEERTRDNAVVRKRKVSTQQYWEALKEPRFYLIFIMAMLNGLQNGALVLFANVLVKSLGFTTFQSILLQIPSGTISSGFVIVAVILHRKTGQLAYTGLVLTVVSAVGCLLLAVLPQSGVKLLGYYLQWTSSGTYTLTVVIISSTVSGYSKKIFYNGMLMISYTLGNFVGPLMMVAHEAPTYKSAMWGYFAANIVVILSFYLVRRWLARINKKKAAGRTDTPTDVNLNLTDREDPNWSYLL